MLAHGRKHYGPLIEKVTGGRSYKRDAFRIRDAYVETIIFVIRNLQLLQRETKGLNKKTRYGIGKAHGQTPIFMVKEGPLKVGTFDDAAKRKIRKHAAAEGLKEIVRLMMRS